MGGSCSEALGVAEARCQALRGASKGREEGQAGRITGCHQPCLAAKSTQGRLCEWLPHAGAMGIGHH